jgi:hypothetical protein
MVNSLKQKHKQSHKGYFSKKDLSDTNKKLFQFEIINDESFQYSEAFTNLRSISHSLAIKTNYLLDFNILDIVEFDGRKYIVQGLEKRRRDSNLSVNKLVKSEYNKNVYWIILLG